MIVLAAWCLFEQTNDQDFLGWLLVGYLIASVNYSIRRYIRTRASWAVYEKYLDWPLIEAKLAVETIHNKYLRLLLVC
jgi:hypothetical protein